MHSLLLILTFFMPPPRLIQVMLASAPDGHATAVIRGNQILDIKKNHLLNKVYAPPYFTHVENRVKAPFKVKQAAAPMAQKPIKTSKFTKITRDKTTIAEHLAEFQASAQREILAQMNSSSEKAMEIYRDASSTDEQEITAHRAAIKEFKKGKKFFEVQRKTMRIATEEDGADQDRKLVETLHGLDEHIKLHQDFIKLRKRGS